MSMMIETRTALPTGTWNVDPVHSQVGFEIDYMGGTFRGTFSPFEGKLESSDDGGARLEGSAPVTGIRVQDENLAAHLQSPEFFDAEQHPELRFVSTQLLRDGDQVTAQGELTMRGTTRPVELQGTIGEPAEDAYGNLRFALDLETTVDRTAFGLEWNNPLPNGEPALANHVTLTAHLYLVRA